MSQRVPHRPVSPLLTLLAALGALVQTACLSPTLAETGGTATTLTIPMAAPSGVRLFYLNETGQPLGEQNLEKLTVSLLVGQELPTGSLKVRLLGCQLVSDMSLSLSMATSPVVGLDVDTVGDEVTLTAGEVGSFVVNFTSVFRCTDSPEIERELELELTVNVIEAAAASVLILNDCRQHAAIPQIQSGAALSDFIHGMSVVDMKGEAVSPLNRAVGQALELTLTADPGVTLTQNKPSLGIRGVSVTGAGEVTISYEGKVFERFRVVSNAKIGAFDAAFGVRLAHGGAFERLAQGETFGPSSDNGPYEPRLHIIVPSMKVDGIPLCSKTNADDFEVVSLTPDVCQPAGAASLGRVSELSDPDWPESFGIEAAELVSAGTCRVVVSAPSFSAAALPVEFSADFPSWDAE